MRANKATDKTEMLPGDYPDPACEFLLPEADWVFLSATSIINKTFPRLVELSQDAQLVLMGPTAPWLPDLALMGVNYLAGVAVTDPLALRQTIAEGGGRRIFETGVEYRVIRLWEESPALAGTPQIVKIGES